MKIFLIEDDFDERLVFEKYLKSWEYEIEVFEDAETALEQYEKQPCSLVITDVHLPGMDGLEFCRKVRSLPQSHSTMILVVTGHEEANFLQSILESGADDYMAKPIPFPLLRIRLAIIERQLQNLIQRKKTEDRLRDSEEKHRVISENISDYVYSYLLPLEGGIKLEWIAGAFEKITGYSIEMMISKPEDVPQFIHPDDVDIFHHCHHKMLNNESVIIEYRIFTKSGEIRWLKDYIKPIYSAKENRITKILGAVQDITQHKLADEVLIKERDIAQRYLDIAAVIMVLIGPDQKVKLINRKGADLLGCEEEEIIGKNWFDYFLPVNIREEYRTNFITLMNEKSVKMEHVFPMGTENEVLTKTGHRKLIRWHNTLVYDDNGDVLGTLSSGEDITAEQNALQELHLLKRAVEIVQLGITISDLDGRIIYTNPAEGKMHGYSVDELLGKEARIFAPDEFRNTITVEKLKHIKNWKRESLNIRKDGSVFPVQLVSTSVTDAQGKFMGIVTICDDITERKKSQEELVAEKELLSVTLSSVAEGVITMDIKGAVILINKSAEKLTGWKQKDAKGKIIDEILRLLESKTHHPMENIIKRVIDAQGKTVSSELSIMVSRDGTEILIAFNAAPICDRNTNIIGVVIAIRDITESQKIQEKLQRIDKLESIGVLAGGIAHDFNNILTAVMVNISLAKIYSKADDKVYDSLSKIENVTYGAKDLAQQLLTLAKGGSAVKKLASIGDILRDITEFSLRGSKVRGEFSLPDDLCPVDVDKEKIIQVISNLILNAKQAMPDGGTILVKAENYIIEEDDESLPLREGKFIKITIKDQGMGISKEYAQKIFDPYFTTKEKGSGLGLAVSYAVIKRHDGHIDFESQPGIGTTFYIYLPASNKKLLISAEDEGSQDLSGKGRILLMDDENVIREVTGEILSQLGYQVELASSGEEAVELYKAALEGTDSFDVVIADLTIPGGMGGTECVKQLLEIDPNVKAIVASGYSNHPIMEEYEKYGFKGVVIKPFKIQELSHVLHNVMRDG